MSTDDERSDPGRLLTRTAAMRARGRRLAARIGQLAGEIASTEEQLADQRERLATTRPDRAQELRRGAEQARWIAAHERREQERWQSAAQDGE